MLARQAEQIVSAQARLNIFKCHIIDRFTLIAVFGSKSMADILKHQFGGWLDVYFLSRNTHRIHQLPCVGFCAVRGRKAGHGEAANGAARQLQSIASLRCNDQRMGAIKAARYANDERFGLGCLHPPDEAIDLDVEGFKAILVQTLTPPRHKGKAPDAAHKANITLAAIVSEAGRAIAILGPTSRLSSVAPSLIAKPLGCDFACINIDNAQFWLAIETSAFRQQIAHLIDDALPIPRKVSRAFPMPAG